MTRGKEEVNSRVPSRTLFGRQRLPGQGPGGGTARPEGSGMRKQSMHVRGKEGVYNSPTPPLRD